ncbi:MAG: hypothetical protein COV35_10340 [Alphaproteobacteria bacterium CG11_big_fil_rev_8_21_14_0_20_39_49]|nr:MAG: hypothetical protein COV35_10340 [Alphaproteobacteria bacterium CG11_big_fil_rev_8_21_14_0_20_39_49]
MDKNIKFDFFYNKTEHHLVQKYFSLRESAFIDQWNLKKFSGKEDKYDKDATIIIMHKHNVCLGGGRLIIHNIGSDTKLPAETDGFSLDEQLPELNLAQHKYGELSRIAISNEYRNGLYSAEMYRRLIDVKARDLDIDYLFCVTKMQLARASRISLKKLNLPFEIKPKIKVPDLPTYEGHKMVLSLIDLTNTHSTKYQERLQIKDTV